MEPRDLAEQVERSPKLPPGSAERFDGYGVMSLPFDSGHLLALRRFPASSVGPAFTTIWRRSPDGVWSFYTDVEPSQSCPRYFADRQARTAVTPVELAWASDRELTVRAGGELQLDWRLTFAPTRATRFLNAVGSLLPPPLWRQRWMLALMGRMAGTLLRAGRVRLYGTAPNGQWFVANPKLIWAVAHSQASLGGHDLGRPAPLAEQARLGDFWLPQAGLFAIGQAYLEPLDPARHTVLPAAALAQL